MCRQYPRKAKTGNPGGREKAPGQFFVVTAIRGRRFLIFHGFSTVFFLTLLKSYKANAPGYFSRPSKLGTHFTNLFCVYGAETTQVFSGLKQR